QTVSGVAGQQVVHLVVERHVVCVVRADGSTLLAHEPVQTQVTLELGHWRHDTGGSVLLAQRVLYTAREVFIAEVGVVGSGQGGFEGSPVSRVVGVAGPHVEQVDPHRADVGGLADDLDDLLGLGVSDHARGTASGIGCQPGIGGIAGGRAGGGVIGS